MATVRDVVTDALRELGVLAAGETASADDAAYGFSSLNDLVDQWAAERLQIYTVTRTTWTLVSGTAAYTIGSGGDVSIARPVYVDHINFEDQSPTEPVEYQLDPLTEDAHARLPIKTLDATLPTHYYYNPTYPLATVTFWPVPSSATLKGVIYTPTAVAEFADLDTSVALPPGYRRMLIKNVALDMAPAFERQPSPGLLKDAADSVATVKRSNKRLMDMSVEVAALVQGRARFTYNILTGP